MLLTAIHLFSTEITIDDDDDVIVLPPSEEVVTEIPDDDDIETVDSHSTADETRATSVATVGTDENSKPSSEAAAQPVAEPPAPRIIETRIDDDIAIQEPSIERIDVNDLDDSDAQGCSSAALADESSQMSVKVKEEPKDDDEVDEEDELFEDVGTIESSMVESTKETGKIDG